MLIPRSIGKTQRLISTLLAASQDRSSTTALQQRFSTNTMDILRVVKEGITHPFGDSRTVQQAFPSAIPVEDADPFLMCDTWDSVERVGPAEDPDHFPVGWHPHRGFDICTYLKHGVGRHGDSLGNRVTFDSPGMQWMATGSGVVHAEGGATPKGERNQGFQIWINSPAESKMDNPRYGTVPPQDMPPVQINDTTQARVLAGEAFGVKGSFETTVPILMVDFELQQQAQEGENDTKEQCADNDKSLSIPLEMDTAMLYVYEGEINVNQHPETVSAGHVILLNAAKPDSSRKLELSTSGSGKVLLFAGKKLKEPVVWKGPIVMNTEAEMDQTYQELHSGGFPWVQVDWDYRRIATKPKDEEAKN